MCAFKWNLCSSFALIGATLAYAIVVTTFGFHWQLLPGAIVGLVVVFFVANALGTFVASVQVGRYPFSSAIIGIGVALVTLFAGAVAIGITNFAIATNTETTRAPSGQPIWNVLAEVAPGNAIDYIAKPVVIGMTFGLLPAVLLGIVYGVMVHASFETNLAESPPARKRALAATVGTVLLLVLLGVSMMQLRWTAEQPADVPMAINECGEIFLATGVLAYCKGHPCTQGQCQWDLRQDAFALYVEPPADRDWRWTGGGIGTSRRPGEVKHNMYWARQKPEEFLSENTPRKYVSYGLRFDDDSIEISDQRFQFEPGMLMLVQYDDDWSITASVGADALSRTSLTIEDLQREFDRACTQATSCEKAFQIRRKP